MEKKIKAIIFDMDGVLIDSELYWGEIERDFFESRGVKYTKRINSQVRGRPEKEMVAWAKREYGFTETVDELLAIRDRMTEKIYSVRARPMAGIEDLLKKIRKKGYKSGIASSSVLRRIKMIVERLGWQSFFDKLMSSVDEGCDGKPAPDIYLRATKALTAAPENCVVLEDTENGVRAAKRAGMRCVAITDKRWQHGDLSRADLLIDSLADKKLFEYLNL
ncbi:MAG: HAD family phosphatase [Patescibacteria group bacterium]